MPDPVFQPRGIDPWAVQELTDAGIHPVMARVLNGRGVTEPESISLLLRDLEHPDSIRDLRLGAQLVADHVLRGQKVVIAGDYDVDGCTSTVLLMDFLTQCGAQVDYLIPNRVTEGYGLSPGLVDRAVALSAACIITVDNGISAFSGVQAAKDRGLTVVVSDHHLAGESLPPADAIVNPNQPLCAFPWKSTCGVGVAFYLAAAIKKVLMEAGYAPVHGLDMGQFLDLVALGTVADVVPLERNNRIFIRAGIQRMRRGATRQGLLALMQVSGVYPPSLQADDLAFRLGPRINAVGRLDDMSIGVRLLLTHDAAEAETLAKTLQQFNGERQQVEGVMLDNALERVTEQMGAPSGSVDGKRIVCLFDPDGHEGVVGLVAGRIKEKMGLPAIVFARAADPDLIKGSARSIPGVHIRDLLAELNTLYPDLIVGFGGHAMAAGLSVRAHDFDRFCGAMDALADQRIPLDALQNKVWTDGEIEPEFCTLSLAQTIEEFGPYGNGFPVPVFYGQFRVVESKRIGKDLQTLKLSLSFMTSHQGTESIAGIQFKRGDIADPGPGDVCRLVYSLSINRFRGDESLQLMIQSLVM